MSEQNSFRELSEIQQWQLKIKTANYNNIFCHCRDCRYEWIDSSFEASCTTCGSTNVEHISCWQFPDD